MQIFPNLNLDHSPRGHSSIFQFSPLRPRLTVRWRAQGKQFSGVTELAREIGLEYRLTDAHPGNTFDAVRADEARAAKIGITAVSFFLFDEKTTISGAQPVEVFAEMLQKM